MAPRVHLCGIFVPKQGSPLATLFQRASSLFQSTRGPSHLCSTGPFRKKGGYFCGRSYWFQASSHEVLSLQRQTKSCLEVPHQMASARAPPPGRSPSSPLGTDPPRCPVSNRHNHHLVELASAEVPHQMASRGHLVFYIGVPVRAFLIAGAVPPAVPTPPPPHPPEQRCSAPRAAARPEQVCCFIVCT